MLIFNNEKSSTLYKTHILSELLEKETNNDISVRDVSLGHVMVGVNLF
jgi:hypothetical protein